MPDPVTTTLTVLSILKTAIDTWNRAERAGQELTPAERAARREARLEVFAEIAKRKADPRTVGPLEITVDLAELARDLDKQDGVTLVESGGNPLGASDPLGAALFDDTPGIRFELRDQVDAMREAEEGTQPGAQD